MPRKIAFAAFTLIGGAVLFGAFAGRHSVSGAAPAPKFAHAKAARTPVIVELFTSEGCSSCPPADRLLMKLRSEQPIDGAQIITLSEHVDYWNTRAWNDPYSSATFTNRQAEYVKALRADSAYTPQAVVDGQSEFIGSDDESASAAITRAAKTAKAEVDLTGEVKNEALQLKIKIGPVTGLAAGEKADVALAITEDNLHSQVAGGENSGRRLNHTGVVRELKSVRVVTRSGLDATFAVPLNSRWKRGDLQAVVFIQARNSRRILGAAAIPVK